VRPLTALELLAVYDIPQQENLFALSYEKLEDLPFLFCAPLKALYQALQTWTPTANINQKPNLLPDSDLTPLAVAYPNLHF